MAESKIKKELKKILDTKNINDLGVLQKYRVYESKMNKPVLEAGDIVQLARDAKRPKTLDYIKFIFDDFIELHGDRLNGDDESIVGGIASINGMPVTVIGQQKGNSTKDNIKRRFGMPNPDGYRKALRLMKQAEKFNRPIITFVDTPGAYPGLEAEERGQGEAIARNLFEMSGLTVPVISFVIGEGGSGGALALAVANKIFMLQNSIYSILSPEGYASILYKDGSRAKEAAKHMKLTAHELKSLDLIDGIIEEPTCGISEYPFYTAMNMKEEILNSLRELKHLSRSAIREDRYKKFRIMGEFDRYIK